MNDPHEFEERLEIAHIYNLKRLSAELNRLKNHLDCVGRSDQKAVLDDLFDVCDAAWKTAISKIVPKKC